MIVVEQWIALFALRLFLVSTPAFIGKTTVSSKTNPKDPIFPEASTDLERIEMP